MAYMHELVHVCHLDCPFFVTLPVSKGYPSIFVFEPTGIAPRYRKRLNFLLESCPMMKEIDEKNFSEKNFFMIKNFLKNIFVE